MDNPVGNINISRPLDGADFLMVSDFLVKGLFLVTFGIFVIFSFVLLRQVMLMDKTVQTGLAPFLKIIALAMLMVTSGLFFLVLISF